MATKSVLSTQKIMAFVGTQSPARAKAFYGDTLGLRLISEDGFALAFDANGIMLRVTKVHKVAAAPYTVLGWQVENIAATAEALRNSGVTLERFPGMTQDELGIWESPGGGRVAWFKDPDGNTLSIAEV
jgi:catechol 2,3-dioxygenase-like lactoylglutathione lyase family enzyme